MAAPATPIPPAFNRSLTNGIYTAYAAAIVAALTNHKPLARVRRGG